MMKMAIAATGTRGDANPAKQVATALKETIEVTVVAPPEYHRGAG